MGFDEIKGQDRAIKILRQVINNKHLAHAYLFHGPDGVGKKKASMTFAKALNCADFKDDVCDICVSCHKINQGIHPDVTLIQTEKGEIKIGEIRNIIKGMIYKPLEAKNRIVIVDESERFNLSASNAFLKTLEEPPADTVIILVSSNPDMLPQTVLSRCHRIAFSNIPTRTLTDILIEKNGLTPVAADHIANLANGSVSKALSLSSEEVQGIRMDILSVLSGKGNVKGNLFDLAEQYSKDEKIFYEALDWIYTYFRDIIMMKVQSDLNLIINRDFYDHMISLKEKISLETLLDIIEYIKSVYKGQERNMNRQLALDVLGIKIMRSIA